MVPAPPRPPEKSESPDTATSDAAWPGMAARDRSAASGLMADTVELLFTTSLLIPNRRELITRGLKMWLSSRTKICRFVLEPMNTLSRLSGVVKGGASYKYGPTRLSLSEHL